MAVVNIGGKVEKESVTTIGEFILRILDARNDELTIQKALSTFEATCPKSSADYTTLSRCTIGNFKEEGGEDTE